MGGTAPSVIVGLTQGSHAEPMARKRSTGQKTVRMTRQSVKRVIRKITS